MTPHIVVLFDKKIKYTDKSVFRVEESRNVKASYEGLYSHSDPVKVIRYYNSTVKPAGWKIRLIKDGDEFIVINKKQF